MALATYEVTAPDGTAFDVTAPEGASEADVLAYAKSQWAAQVGTGGKSLTAAQRLAVLKAQRDDPTRNPDSTPELETEIARLEKAAGVQPSAPAASQADVRKSEPPLSPMEEQRQNERVFKGATERYMDQTGRTGLDITPSTEPAAPAPNEFFPGRRPDGPGGVRQQVEQATGMTDPAKTREQAGIEELRQGGDVAYGDSLPYTLAKGTAGVAGFIGGGPGGATLAESAVRLTALASNLKKALDAGAIDEDRAVELLTKEMASGVGEDALFNFGVPLLGKFGLRIAQKVIGKFRGTPVMDAERAAQAANKVASRASEAPTPAGSQAVDELTRRMPGGEVPTPGQVTGEAGWWEGIARKANPQIFGRQQDQLDAAAQGLRQDLLNPAAQPTRQALGDQALQVVNDTERALKTRLRPTFDAADNLGVRVDMQPVVDQARAALAKLERTNGHPEEIGYFKRLIETLESQHPANLAGNPMVSAEDTLDMMSGLKEKLRSTTADWKPSAYFDKVVGDIVKTADGQYAAAASRAGKPYVIKNLLAARNDYREFMETAYDDAFKTALKRQPEDIGRLFWQGGNVSEIQQFQKMLRIAQREGALGNAEAQRTMRDMTRGFLQEAVPTVEAAANWSKTLAENPLKRDTWTALTSTPGGAQLKSTMELLEQAAKIASRDSSELLRNHSIPLFVQRAASGSAGYSPVTGAARPGIIATAFGLTGLTRLAATAYTQGNKGVANLLTRALRANTAGTAISAKVAQELKDYADKNGVDLAGQ